MNILTTLFSFCGRHNRGRFWLISVFALSCLLFLVAGLLSYASATQPAEKAAVATIIICWLAIVLWFQTANLVKRLHDLDASGWWTLPIYLIGSAFAVLVVAAGPQARGGILLIAAIFGLGILAIIAIREGTEGENNYGPDPLSEL